MADTMDANTTAAPLTPSGSQRDRYGLTDATVLNVVVGRNGAGKSRLLRSIHAAHKSAEDHVSYLSPERVGVFKVEAHIEQNLENTPDFAINRRANNQAVEFKQLSAIYLRRLEMMFYRKEQYKDGTTFAEKYLDRINNMLSNLKIVVKEEGASGFDFLNLEGDIVAPESISSGESEIVALAADIMYFFATSKPDKANLLLLDEPDAHQHPDLQARFARFLIGELNLLAAETLANTTVILATHSTPLVCALASSQYTSLGTKHFGQDAVIQKSPGVGLRQSLMFFGHPLSQVIGDDPLLILEGGDDERVWSQVARTSQGRIRLFPCIAEGKSKQPDLEAFCGDLLKALYESPIAFSIYDGDGKRGKELEAVGPIRRFRIDCYEIENALVSDEALKVLGSTWSDFQSTTHQWIEENASHKDIELLKRLIESPDRLRDEKIKSISQLIVAILKKSKPWEVVIGQAVGTLAGPAPAEVGVNSIVSYLGVPLLVSLGVLQEHPANTGSEAD